MRKRISVKLSKEVKRDLKKWIGQQETRIDAAEMLLVTPVTLWRIQKIGSCSPDTADKINNILYTK